MNLASEKRSVFTYILIIIGLFFFSYYVLKHKYMDIPNVLTLWAVIVALMSSISSLRLNYKTLEQSGKNLETQLIYEDRKRALTELYNLIDFPEKKEGQNHEEINEEINFKLDQIKTFLKNPVAIFLPYDTFTLLFNLFNSLEVYYTENRAEFKKLTEKMEVATEKKNEKVREKEHEHSDQCEVNILVNEIEDKLNELEKEKVIKLLDFKKEIRQNIKYNLINFQKE